MNQQYYTVKRRKTGLLFLGIFITLFLVSLLFFWLSKKYKDNFFNTKEVDNNNQYTFLELFISDEEILEMIENELEAKGLDSKYKDEYISTFRMLSNEKNIAKKIIEDHGLSLRINDKDGTWEVYD